jgi:uncharacterized protein (DUF58 family)
MAYDADVPVVPDENLLSRRPWYLVGVLILLLSLLLRMPMLIVAGLLVIVLGGVPDLWYRYCLAGVTVRRTFSVRRAEIGDEVTLALAIENRKLLPLPRLEVEDEVPAEELAIQGAHLEESVKPLRLRQIDALSMWAFQRVTRRYRVRCLWRGIHVFGPLTVRSGDPFGLLTRERTQMENERLLVYPLVLPIERFGLPAHAPFGERPAPRRLLEDPLRIAGVRPYEPGDEPRRVHWKATARTGQLQSKIYEPSAHHTLAIFVDQRTYANPAMGYEAALVELGICVAASVAAWGLDQGYAVGLYANGLLARHDDLPAPRDASERTLDDIERQIAIQGASLRMRIPPSTDRRQLVRMLEALARVIPLFPPHIRQTLGAEETRLPYGTTVVYIGTPAGLGNEGLAPLRRLKARGHAVTLLLVGEEAMDVPDLPVTRVGDVATWQRLLDDALARRGLDRRGRQVAGPQPSSSGVPAQRPTLEMEGPA